MKNLEFLHLSLIHIFILGIGNYEGEKEIDVKGAYIAPGFVDCHIHIESTMVTPSEFSRLVAPWGVTTVIADPHEIANVAGEKGLKFMLEDSKNSPVDIEFMLPSCVPATPFDDSGAVIDGNLTKEFLSKYDFKGLGEMMNSVGVVNCDEDIMKKLDCDCIKDGHAPMLELSLIHIFTMIIVLLNVLKYYKFKGSIDLKSCVKIYKFGVPSIILQSLYTFYIVGLNLVLKLFTEDAVAVLGIYYKLQTFFFIPLTGLQQVIVPVVSYNYGAEKYKRVKQTLWYSVGIACSVMLVGIIMFMVFPRELISIFSQQEDVLNIGRCV